MPNSASNNLKRFAELLLAEEALIAHPLSIEEKAVFLVCERLRKSLITLTGVAGFRSLLSRSLALANEEVRWLKALHVKTDGSLEGLAEVEAQLSQADMAEGEILLVAHLLGLLIIFIGQDLTLRLVHDAWPKIPFGNLDFGMEEKP